MSGGKPVENGGEAGVRQGGREIACDSRAFSTGAKHAGEVREPAPARASETLFPTLHRAYYD